MKFQHCILVSVVLLILIVAGVLAIGYENQKNTSHRVGDEIKVLKFPLPPMQPMISDNFKIQSTHPPIDMGKNKIIETLFRHMKESEKNKSDDEEEETTANYVRRKIIVNLLSLQKD